MGIQRRGKAKETEKYTNLKKGIIPNDIILNAPSQTKQLFGKYPHREKGKETGEYSVMYDKSRYKFMLDAPFEISNMCCKVMKKQPIHTYTRKEKRFPITAQMAEESNLRTAAWLKNGCNAFDSKNPISNPMSFWLEQDVLQYIKKNNLRICSVYGEIVTDYKTMGQCDNQMSIADYGLCEDKPILKTTGCDRTGCMLCGFGCHLEKESRFLRLKETHPAMYQLLDRCENNGYTFRQALKWVNEHGNMNIRF